MDDLIGFLNSRLDELEVDFDGHYGRCAIWVDGGAETWCTCGGSDLVKADIAAKRQIIAEHEPVLRHVEWPDDQTGRGKGLVCPRCQNAENDSDNWNPAAGEADSFPHENFVTPYVLAPCRTLRLLALPFASHPEYRENWRP